MKTLTKNKLKELSGCAVVIEYRKYSKDNLYYGYGGIEAIVSYNCMTDELRFVSAYEGSGDVFYVEYQENPDEYGIEQYIYQIFD